MTNIIGTVDNDKKKGTKLADNIEGLAGNDTLTGEAGNDTLIGDIGDDSLDGGAGNDSMVGGAGDDTYVVNGTDTVTELEDEGTDTVKSAVTYTLGEHVENLVLTGKSAINGTGNANANTLTGNAGTNTLTGGDGADLYVVQTKTDVIVEEESDGDDTVNSSVTFTLQDNVEALVLEDRSKAEIKKDKLINGTGNSGQNSLTGNSENNILDGSEDQDTMIGLAGNDTYFVDDADDSVVEAGNQGTDTVKSTINYTLGDNLENLLLLGEGNLNGTGNGVKNVLTGNAGNNSLNGGEGADNMKGLGGNDTYVVDNVKDAVTEGEDAGTDTVVSSLSHTLDENLENLTLLGEGNLNGTGNDETNSITGNDGNNNLSGGKANDTLSGGAGNDTLNGGAGIDVMTGGEGNDTYTMDTASDEVVEEGGDGTDTVSVGFTYTLGANFENLSLTGKGHITGIGNTEDNVLTGNSGNNTLDGREGEDTMIGGDGNDLYFVDEAGDVVTETSTKGGTDRVESTASFYTLGANIENLTLLDESSINGTGNAQANVITGNSGSNSLNGAAGNDTLNGGSGNDSYVFSTGFGKDVINDDSGTDEIDFSGMASAVTVNLTASSGHEVASGSNTVNWITNLIENVTGSSANDVITGNTFNNRLLGDDGNDSLVGDSGDDTLNGGSGTDTMVGGSGDDRYEVDSENDSLVESAESGDDSVYSDVSFTLGANLERLTLNGIGNLNGTGNEGNNYLYGNSGDNSLSGGDGSDVLTGGGDGEDTLVGGTGNDIYVLDADYNIVENAEEGTDEVEVYFSYTLGDNVEDLQLLSDDNINGTGNALSNSIFGNSGNNILNGGSGGDDTMEGGAGSDTYVISDEDRDNSIIDFAGDADTIDMSDATAAVQIDLAEGTVNALVEDEDSSAEFEITTESSINSQYPHAVRLIDNTIVVLWYEGDTLATIYAQRYSEEGVAMGDQVVIDKIGGNFSAIYGADITALDDGGYAVAWTQKGNPEFVYVQRFEANGTLDGSTVQASTSSTEGNKGLLPGAPIITSLSNGGFAVGWGFWDSEDSSPQDSEVYGQVFDEEGAPLGNDFILNNSEASAQNTPAMTGLKDGGFVTVWDSNQDRLISGQQSNIYFKIFDNDGEQVLGETRANTFTAGAQADPSVAALNSGGFVVVWISYNQTGDDGVGVYGQLYNAAGTEVGSEFHINTTTDGSQGEYGVHVASLTNGGFVVTWADEFDIVARIYDDEANAESAEIEANTITNGAQWYPSAVGTAGGGFLLSWMSDGDIYGRSFDSEGNAESLLESVSVATIDEETEIENAYGGDGSDTLIGNDADNLLDGGAEGDTLTGGAGDDTLMGGAGEDTYTGFSGEFGDDVIDDASNSGTLELANFDSEDDITWTAVDSAGDEDNFVDQLLLTFESGASITIANFFNNTSVDDDASAAGTGYLAIECTDNLDIDFAQAISLVV